MYDSWVHSLSSWVLKVIKLKSGSSKFEDKESIVGKKK